MPQTTHPDESHLYAAVSLRNSALWDEDIDLFIGAKKDYPQIASGWLVVIAALAEWINEASCHCRKWALGHFR